MIKIVRADSENADFVTLVALLDSELRVRDGDDHAFYAQFNKIDSIREVVVVYSDEAAVGCGAIKPYADGTAEIKRMFVAGKPRTRDRGTNTKGTGVLGGGTGFSRMHP